MTRTRQARLIEGRIAPTLAKLTVTMLVGIFSMIAFNLVDTFFLGRLGTESLAAISFTFPVVMAIGSLALGLGVGAAALVSRAIGTGDDAQVRRLTTDSLALALVIVGVFVVLGLATVDPMFRMLGADNTTLPLVRSYMVIWYPGMIFVVVPMVGNNSIRATGDTRTPSMIMLTAVLVNVVLDPILIFGLGPVPALGIRGAAIATVVARATTLVIAIRVLYIREKMITLQPPPVREALRSWGRLLYIGLPAAATNVIIPVGLGIVTAMVAVYGQEAVAGLGVASRVEGFAMALIMALSSVLGPFTGQNWGAGRLDRVKDGIRISQGFAMAWGAITFVLLLIIARPLAAVFNDDPGVIDTIVLYMALVPISYGLFGVLHLSNTALNTLNRPLHAGALMILRMFVLYVPLAYAGSRILGMPGVFAAAAIANIVAGVAAYLWLRHVQGGLSVAPPAVGRPVASPASATR